MAEIIVYYAREDSEAVSRLVEVLEKRWTVWWDRKLVHGDWDAAVESETSKARCAIPVWSSHSLSKDCEVKNEASHAKKSAVPLLHVLLENVNLPMQFTDEQTSSLNDWKGQKESHEIKALLERVQSVLRSPNPTRELNIGDRSIQLPCFVRSVSSHETLLTPKSALLALAVHPSNEPILVSAFDMHKHLCSNSANMAGERREIEKRLATIRERCVVFLDSGNYEAFRTGERGKGIGRKKKRADWNDVKFHKTIKKASFDVAFSFDDTDPPLKIESISKRICAQIKKDSVVAGARQIIPIVHAPRKKDGKLQTDLLPKIVETVVQKLDCPVIAITERELGDGLFERARTVMKIRECLKVFPSYKALHLLGAGNPVSIAVLAAAGADLFDGLEWCRVVVDYDTARLHHPQHLDFFADQTKYSEFQSVREFVADKAINYYMRLFVHNVDFFHRWIQELRTSLRADKVGYMLLNYLGKEPFAQLQAELPEVL